MPAAIRPTQFQLARFRAGLNVTQCARLLCRSRRCIHYWESGARHIDPLAYQVLLSLGKVEDGT
jgi:DNA-binding transcriptional regulator YiaG